MQLTITGKNIELTPALKDHTTEKFKKIEHHHAQITRAQIVLQVEHGSHIAEGTVYTDGTELHASANADDMYQSIDSLIHKLLTQIAKHKNKMIDHR